MLPPCPFSSSTRRKPWRTTDVHTQRSNAVKVCMSRVRVAPNRHVVLGEPAPHHRGYHHRLMRTHQPRRPLGHFARKQRVDLHR